MDINVLNNILEKCHRGVTFEFECAIMINDILEGKATKCTLHPFLTCSNPYFGKYGCGFVNDDLLKIYKKLIQE